MSIRKRAVALLGKTWGWIALGVTLTLASASCGDGRTSESPTAPAFGPPRAATISVSFGETALLPYADGRNGGLLVAQLTNTPQSGRLQTLSFYVHAAAGTLRLGVYDATGPGGGPGNKLAEVAEFTPVVGWNTRAVITPVVMPPANYWLAYFASSDALGFRMDETGSGRWYTLPYGPMPATFATNPSGGAHHWSFYGTLDVETIDAPNAAPTIATAASATPSTVTGSTTALSVRGADDSGEPSLTYRWSVLPGAPGAVTFSDSGTNAARNVTATFTRAGSYTLRATVRDAFGLTATSDLNVSVTQAATTVALEPAPATIVAGGTLRYVTLVRDQFAQTMTTAPTITWSTSGGGAIDGSGLFTASLSPGGPYTITASAAGVSGAITASTVVNVVAAPSGATLGETSVFLTNDNNNRNILSAQRVTLNASGTLQSLSIYIATASGTMRLGVYDATGPNGGPGARLAQSGNVTAIVGWNTVTVSPVALAAGTYWLAFTTNSNALTFRSAATGSARWYTRTYQSLPTTFASTTSSGTVQWSFYATLTNVGPTNRAPTVATAASAIVGGTGANAALAVLGEDDAGEPGLSYTWTTVGTPPGSVTFSSNGTNAAKQSNVSVTRAGDYVFRVTIADALGLVATSDVPVRFTAQPSTIEVSPATASVVANGTQAFTAIVRDQFAQAITPSPTVAWSVTGGGVIDATGSFTAGPAAGGPFTVTATVGAVSASAALTVTALPNQPPTIAGAASAVLGAAPVTSATLTVLGADDAGESALSYLWSVVGTPVGTVQFSANGSNAAKQSVATFTRAGTYEFQVSVTDAQAQSVTSTVTVVVAPAVTSLSVAPSVVTVLAGASQTFTATGADQFAQPIALGTTAWTVAGGGSISTDGIFTAAPVAGGPFVVTARVGDVSATASVSVSALPNAAPNVASAEATLGTAPVTSATLTAIATDDAGEAALSYTWAALGGAPGPVTFTINGNNAAKTTSVAFTRAGSYQLQVTASDAQGFTASRIVSVIVAAAAAEVRVTPATATVLPNGVQDFVAAVSDQFAQPLTPTPSLAWAVTGGGAIDAQGRFTASTVAGGPFSVTATTGAVVGSANISVSAVANQPPSIATGPSVLLADAPTTSATLSVSGVDDAGESSLSYAWSALGAPPAPVQFSANASNAAKRTVATFSRAGEYRFAVTVTDAQGLSASGIVIVTVAPTAQTVTVSPATASLAPNAAQAFTAVITDQFAQAIAPTPSVQWATSGGGGIDAAGLFTAAASGGGPFTVTASAGALSGAASVTITSAPNQSPTVVTAATAVLGTAPTTTAALNVLGADDAGEASLTYTWASVGTPPAAVTFAANGTNAAKLTTATFTRAGSYELQVTTTDALGLSATSAVTVVVAATPTAVLVTPPTTTLVAGGTQVFTAVVNDQFAQPITPTPSVQWTTSGGGVIDAAGLFTAAASGGGPFNVTASAGAVSGTASVTVTSSPNQTPTVATAATAVLGTAPTTTAALSVLGADDAGESTLTYTWASVGTPPAAVTFAANATNAAKLTTATFTRAGSYELQVTITDTLGLSATSLVTVIIAGTPTAVLVTPPTATVVAGGSQTFTAAVTDQFAQPITPLPAVTWATAGGGAIAASGVFTATTAGGPFAVTATVSGVVGTAAISVTAPANQPPTIATPITTPSSTISGTTASLSVAGADDGGAAALRYTWSTIGAVAAPVGFSPNGSNAASATTATFTASGSYTLQVAITDAQGLSATSSIAIVVNLPTQGPESGLDFPGNVAVQSTMRFKFTDPHLNGLPAYGPNGSGVTYIWRAFPRQQAGYYTTFFWGNDDGAGNLSTFYWRGGSPDTYYGAHPYPRGSSQSNVHDWEISTDEADFVNGEVVYGRWYTQALRVWSDAAGKHYEFYWDLPNTDAAHRVVRNSPASYGNINPPAPALTFGDAPWRPGEEVWNGILRGIQIYAGPLTLQEMLNEANTPLSTQAGASAIWYLNSNPTPTDISDKSGRGHNPVWVGAERPTLYTGGPIGPSNQAPSIAAAATPSANPVTGTTVTLSVLGADDQGEPTLVYDWSTVGTPPGPVSFSANGTNGAKTTVATFSASGIYTFRVTVRDGDGLTATSTVSVTVNPQTSGSLTFGESTLLPNIDGGNGNLLVAMQAAVPQGGTLQSLSFYITTAAGQLRLGVYDASGPNGGPGALVATTNAFTPVVGWNTVPSTTAVTLPAGTYWLAYLASSSSLQFLMTPNGSGRWYSVPFGALPSTYSTSPAAGAYHWSFYGTLSVVP